MDARSASRYKWVILALTCCLCFLGNFTQYQVSAYATQVMPALGIDAVGFSLLFLSPMLAAVFFSIPFGVLGDRLGPKTVIAIAFCVSTAGAFMRAATIDSFGWQLVAMFLMGVGMAALTANNAKTLGLWFGERTGLAVGIFYAMSCFGIAAAQVSSLAIPLAHDGYIVSAIALLACTILWAIFDKNVASSADIPSDIGKASSFKAAARSKNVWLLAVAISFSLAATTAFAGVLPQALELEKGLSPEISGSMAAMLTVASIFGCLLTSVLCAKIKRQKIYLIAICLVGAAIIFVSWLPDPSAGLWVLLALNGFATAMMGPVMQAMPVSLPEIGSRYAGSAGGIIAELSLLASYVLPIAIAFLSKGCYGVEMALIAVCYALAAIPVLFLPKRTSR